MANYKIKCEAVDVRSESGTFPGSAKCRKGDIYILIRFPLKLFSRFSQNVVHGQIVVTYART